MRLQDAHLDVGFELVLNCLPRALQRFIGCRLPLGANVVGTERFRQPSFGPPPQVHYDFLINYPSLDRLVLVPRTARNLQRPCADRMTA